MGLSKAEAFFKNEEELEIIYPAEVKSVKDKKRTKEMILKENPEMLLSDYSGPDNNRVRCNLLFFTEHPSSWHTILCSNMTCMRKGGISKGRQLTLEGDNDTKLTVNLYHNGTVMVQGPETSLNEFQRNFGNLKKEVQKIKKDPEVKSQAEDEAGTTSVTITDPSSRTHGHTSTPASPKIKVLKDNIAELEQDFFLFKEETTNNLQHLLNLTSHHNVQQTEQLCSAVRHLEEDNKELCQELRRVREELARREQHGHTLERLLEETRTQLHTIQQQQCVSTQPHSTPTTTTQHQRRVSTQPHSTSTNSTQQSQSSFTPATRQSPQAGWFDKECQNLRKDLRSLSNKKHRDPANHQTRATYQQTLKIYKSLLIQKKSDHMKIKLNKIEEAVDQNYFWELWNNLDKSKEAKHIAIHDPNIWTEHFGNLYSQNEPTLTQKHLTSKLHDLEFTTKEQLNHLDNPIALNELIGKMKSLKNKKSCGLDGISNEMLKHSSFKLKDAILKLFNLVLKSGHFPEIWKENLITPIFKRGEKYDPNNYRVSKSMTNELIISVRPKEFVKAAASARLYLISILMNWHQHLISPLVLA